MGTSNPPASAATAFGVVSWRALGGAAVVLAAVTTAAYRHSFAVPFQFDDLPAIVENPAAHLVELEPGAVLRVLSSSRPLATLSFALNGWLLGPAPAGFHVVNLLIHLLAALLAFVVASQLLRLARETTPTRSSGAVALVAALLFALHPLQTQAVTYLVQRMASLGGLFALLCTAAWFASWSARSRRRWQWLAFVAWLAACATKQNYVVLPLVLLLVEALFAPGARRPALTLGALASVLMVGGGVGLAMREVLAAEYTRMGLGPWQTLIEQPRVLVQYLSLVAWPHPDRLRVDRLWELSGSLLEGRVLGALGLLLVLAGGAWALRRRAPLVTFAVLWFFGNLAIEQTLLPVDLYFEHRLYLPLFGPLLLVAVGLEALSRRMRVGVLALAAPVLLAAGLATDTRNGLWRDPAALHAQAVSDGHGTPRSWDIIGEARLAVGDLGGAEAAFRSALSCARVDGVALANLGVIAEQRGDLGGAEQSFRAAIAADPALRQPRVALVLLLARSGRVEEAGASAEAWLALRPAEPHAWYAKGAVLALERRHDAAREAFTRALQLDPGLDAALRDRAVSALAVGRWAEAVGDLERVVALRPGGAQAWRELGYARERLSQLPGAIEAYEAALRLEPGQGQLADYVARLRAGGR